MKKILIIGGAGFIGINSARNFIKKGWDVTILDSLIRPGTKFNIQWLKKDFGNKFKFIKGDIVTDLKLLNLHVSKSDVVIHLAAQVAVTTSIEDPRQDFLVNAYGTFNVLEAVRISKNKPILLYSSTNKVYGSLKNLDVVEKKTKYEFKDKKIRQSGVDEKAPIDFHSPYGCSKGAADHYVVDYSRIFNLRTVVLRQSCIYGEYQMGVEDQGWVAWFAIAALLGKKITLFGNGKQVRDLLYVGDLISLYEAAIKNIDKASGHAFNVGGGTRNTMSLIECLDMLGQKLNIDIKTSTDKIRMGDQPIFISNNSKAFKVLGWKPSVPVNRGIDLMLSWIINNKKSIEKAK